MWAPYVEVFGPSRGDKLGLGCEYILVLTHSPDRTKSCWFVYDHNNEVVLQCTDNGGQPADVIEAYEVAKEKLVEYDRERCMEVYRKAMAKKKAND